MLKKLNNYEMSKRILYILAMLILALFPVVVIVSLVTGDASSLCQYVIGVFALASVAVGFYYWKAKNENLHKYAKEGTTDSAEVLKKELELLEDIKADVEGGV